MTLLSLANRYKNKLVKFKYYLYNLLLAYKRFCIKIILFSLLVLASDVGYTKNTKQKLQLFIPNEEIKAFSANVNLIVKFAKYQSVVSLYYENETVPLSSQFVTFVSLIEFLLFMFVNSAKFLTVCFIKFWTKTLIFYCFKCYELNVFI